VIGQRIRQFCGLSGDYRSCGKEMAVARDIGDTYKKWDCEKMIYCTAGQAQAKKWARAKIHDQPFGSQFLTGLGLNP